MKLNDNTGIHWRQSKHSKRRAVLKDDFGYYIPILKVLELLLNNDQIIAEVDDSHQRTDGLLGDICDGIFFQKSPSFQGRP